MKELLSVREVAKLFQVTEETIRRWARGKKIPTAKYGEKWMFNYATITGEQSERKAKELLGKNSIRQKPHFDFDILCEGRRIEVKSSSLMRYKTYRWVFYIDQTIQSDWFLFLCYDGNHQILLRSYFVPSLTIPKLPNKKYYSFHLDIDDESLEQYRIFQINIKKERR